MKPVTMGDLRRTGQLLEVSCMNCAHIFHVDPATTDLPDELPVRLAAAKVHCSVCGSKNTPIRFPIYTRPDARL